MPVKIWRGVFLALFLPCLGLLAQPRAVAAADLRLGYPDQAAYPFHVGEGSVVPQPPGMAVDLTLRLLRQAGLSADLLRLPIRRLHEEMRAGRVDGWIGLSYTPERGEYLAYPLREGRPDAARRLLASHSALYRPLGGTAHWNAVQGNPMQGNIAGGMVAGLHGGPLAMPAGYALVQELRAAGQSVEEFGDAMHMFRLLELGRLGAVLAKANAADRLIETLAAQHLAAGKESPRIEKLSGDVARDYFLPVSKRLHAERREAIEKVWSGLAAQRDAVYAELAPLYR